MESQEYNILFFQDEDTNSTSLTFSEGTMDKNEIIVLSIMSFMGIVVLFIICCCCCSASIATWVDNLINNNLSNGDDVYSERALRRMEEDEEKKKEDPAVRKQKLLESFDRNKVSMVVTKDSFVKEKGNNEDHCNQKSDSSIATESINSGHSSSDKEDESNELTVTSIMDDLESNEPKEIYLNSTKKMKNTGKKMRQQVANSCAICLCSYDIDDVVVWSSNKQCTHAFHDECILQWLVKNQNGECPCCRNQFTDLPPPDGKANKQHPSQWPFRGWMFHYNFLSQRDNSSVVETDTSSEENNIV